MRETEVTSEDTGGGRPRGQLERSLANLTVGVALGEKQRRRALQDTATGEYEQQFRVPLSGTAAAEWVYTDQPVTFAMPFLYAPLQRRVPFMTPHFNYGIEMTAGTANLVTIDAHVIDWTVTSQNWYAGATVRFAVGAPTAGTADTYAYEAIAHLTFEGYAAAPEVGEYGTPTD